MTETNAGRLKVVQRIYRDMMKHVDENGVVDYPKFDEEVLHLADMGHIKWLIYQAEHAETLGKKTVELNEFLQRYSRPKDLGKNVVDVAMDMIKVQAKRVQELEDWKKKALKINQSEMKYRGEVASKNVELKEENKRLREALEESK